MGKEDTYTHSDEDWKNRRLCSDGNCIGIIGPDGYCKECGKKYLGDASAADDFFDPADTEKIPESDSIPAGTSLDEALPDSDWENRKLCSDGNCIGVIGPDGKCKECGKHYEGMEN